MVKLKDIKNTGFSSNISNEGTRLLNKDGSFNVKKEGLTFKQRFSVFHWLITTGWFSFFFSLLTVYVVLNFIFALIYVGFGIEGLSGEHSLKFGGQLMEAFYFSTQTMTTLGYGALSPISTSHNLVASLESFIGLFGFAMSTGLLYGRFAKPKVRMLFSDNVLVSPYKENGKGLMMRMANARDTQLINVSARMTISWVEIINDSPSRKFFFLDLEMANIGVMTSSWTLVHPIDDNSPISELNKNEFVKNNGEIIVIIKAYDETYSNEVHSRTSYKAKEVVWNAKFKKMLGHNDHNQATVNLGLISEFDMVD